VILFLQAEHERFNSTLADWVHCLRLMAISEFFQSKRDEQEVKKQRASYLARFKM